jgi:hypothetical protein
MRFVWIVIALAGCDELWSLDHVTPLDVLAFDPAVDCPASYDVALPVAGSRYRLIQTPERAWVQSDLCNADAPGKTHLVVLDDSNALEAVGVHDELVTRHQFRWWIGAVQRRVAITPSDHWLWITGGSVAGGWNVPVEPDDADMIESDHFEQFVVFEEAYQGLIDITGHDGYNALCECDGRAPDAGVLAAIDGNRE